MFKIAIITCWFGTYPWYFPYFVHSCGYNGNIDFYLITDNDVSIQPQPDNLKIVTTSWDDLLDLISATVNMNVHFKDPYKLCDFRPAYGEIFKDIIKGYDFWGHADMDVVWGNITTFITNDMLAHYDVINSRHDYITGAFCLFKNNSFINGLYKTSRDYKKIFSSSEHFCFDECSFLHHQLALGHSVFDFPDSEQSMTYLIRKAEQQDQLKAFFDFMILEGAPGKIKWHKGSIIYKNEYEALIYHLIQIKRTGKAPSVVYPIPDTFSFTKKTIVYKS